jgi:hypothetical protein
MAIDEDTKGIKLLAQRHGHSLKLSRKVASEVWDIMKSKDCRNIIQVGKLSRDISDVDFIVTILKKYNRKESETSIK